MPARKRRDHLTGASAAEVHADAGIAGLREAAARAGRLHDWLDAARPRGPLGDLLATVEADSAKPRRRLWPFGRKTETPAERFQAILAELKAAAADRPTASERARDQAPAAPAVSHHDRNRAAG